MRRWSACASFAVAIAPLLVGVVATFGGCYDEPQPTCGFRCGSNGECPEGYTCDADQNRCLVDGAPASTVCPTPDAAPDAPAPPFAR